MVIWSLPTVLECSTSRDSLNHSLDLWPGQIAKLIYALLLSLVVVTQRLLGTWLPLDLPTWQPGNPWYDVVYIVSALLALIVLVVALAASLRRGTETVRKTK